jgi:hypothetical protein
MVNHEEEHDTQKSPQGAACGHLVEDGWRCENCFEPVQTVQTAAPFNDACEDPNCTLPKDLKHRHTH